MGKIRVKTLGDETLEKKQKEEVKKRQEAKKTAKVEEVKSEENIVEVKEEKKEEKKTKVAEKTKRAHSKKYQTIAKIVDKNKTYSLSEALEVLPKLHLSKFDETVELHINTIETGITGNLKLPHGTGKKVRVVIANDDVIKEIESGKINFDVLLAEPQMMPKLAKVARVLGPRGLMPNPKNGTITKDPESAAKKFEAGEIRFKTEAKTPIIHLSVGKLSFGDKKLLENIKAVFSEIPALKIKSATLKSTMSPGIKINIAGI